VVLTKGVERCITVYPRAEWQKLSSSLLTGSLSRLKIRKLNRAIFATAFTQPLDGQGRISLPPPLREYADIHDEIVVVGANSYLELWNKEEWAVEKASCQVQAGPIIESLEG
jgi:MraZ protein